MKMKWLKIIYVIIILVSAKVGLAQNCVVNKEIFNTGSSVCSNTNNLEKAIKQYVKNLNASFQNPNNACIPENLRELLEDRLCGCSTKIDIACLPYKKKEVHQKPVCIGGRIVRDHSKYEQRTGGAAGPYRIYFNPDLMKESPDVIEMTLYHEMIHIAENYYGDTVLNNQNVSTEDFSYTCTKNFYNSGNCTTATYPQYEDCPTTKSNCIPCSQYTYPQ